MFSVGQCICYPMHGAGRVEAIEEHEALGESRLYYVLYFYCDGIKVMVPVDNAHGVGLRPVISREFIPEVMSRLCAACEEELSNWNRRYRQNLEKLREGDVISVADVVKALYLREKRRGLSAGEKKMLTNARRFLLGELYLAGGGTEEDLNREIDTCLDASFAPGEKIEDTQERWDF